MCPYSWALACLNMGFLLITKQSPSFITGAIYTRVSVFLVTERTQNEWGSCSIIINNFLLHCTGIQTPYKYTNAMLQSFWKVVSKLEIKVEFKVQ